MITKSDYLRYLECPVHFWLYKKRKDLRPKISEIDQAVFDQGYEVEEYAKKLFPQGTNVIGYFDTGKAETIECVSNGCKTIFQATANPKDLLARSDIFHKNEETNKWDIYEVKSSTKTKNEHIPDLCFQKIAFERNGYEVGETFLIRVNSNYVKQGEIDPKELFEIENLTEEVENYRSIVETDIPKALDLLKIEDENLLKSSHKCKTPRTCMFSEFCWPDLPEYSIYNISRINGQKLKDLRDMGIVKITDVPDDFPLTEKQQNQVIAAKSGRPMIDKEAIISTLDGLNYPLYFLDYETYGQAIPLFDGTKPYQNLCFQYSLHIIRSQGSETEHYEFLATEHENPIPKLLSSLQQHISSIGSVIVWFKGFETKRNEEMAEQYPEYANFLHSINDRIFDLMEIFSNQHYVHPDFKGSCSIKKVLPILVPGTTHSDLNGAQDGATASLHWFKHVFQNSSEKDMIIKNLLEYCKLDTWAMVAIFKELKKLKN